MMMNPSEHIFTSSSMTCVSAAPPPGRAGRFADLPKPLNKSTMHLACFSTPVVHAGYQMGTISPAVATRNKYAGAMVRKTTMYETFVLSPHKKTERVREKERESTPMHVPHTRTPSSRTHVYKYTHVQTHDTDLHWTWINRIQETVDQPQPPPPPPPPPPRPRIWARPRWTTRGPAGAARQGGCSSRCS